MAKINRYIKVNYCVEFFKKGAPEWPKIHICKNKHKIFSGAGGTPRDPSRNINISSISDRF